MFERSVPKALETDELLLVFLSVTLEIELLFTTITAFSLPFFNNFTELRIKIN